MISPRKVCTEAIVVVQKCATEHGFFAAYPGYDAVWSRDSMIISLGASLVKNSSFRQAFAQSIITLAREQSLLGQIPNAVDKFSRRKPHVDFASIDSSLWFIIGNYIYKKRYRDSTILDKHKLNIKKAFTWLRYQDFGESGLLTQQPTSDWQDCFPHRYGYTINTQALYYKVLLLLGENKKADRLRKVVNDSNGLWNGDYYLSWRWKNHNRFHEESNWFDSLGNLLAIVFDLADEKQAEKILAHIKKAKIDQPYPVKAMYPPIKRSSKFWRAYFADSDAKKPYQYLNGGVWTYIGGFYVLALIKCKKFQEARIQLARLAEANLKGDFSEWFHGKTGKPFGGGGQGWNAGMYLLAYYSLKEKKCLI